MASSPETGKEVSEPAAAKDGINEKDPATALGEWYVSIYFKTLAYDDDDDDFDVRIMETVQ
jgi:hypothetical protein